MVALGLGRGMPKGGESGTQCITLSLSDMSRNESLLISASYFWSDALNAFLFGHGPMGPTLADVLLLTGLDISFSDTLFSYRDVQPSHRLKTKKVGGWTGYIAEHMKDSTVMELIQAGSSSVVRGSRTKCKMLITSIFNSLLQNILVLHSDNQIVVAMEVWMDFEYKWGAHSCKSILTRRSRK
jgi:hypothetical protein